MNETLSLTYKYVGFAVYMVSFLLNTHIIGSDLVTNCSAQSSGHRP